MTGGASPGGKSTSGGTGGGTNTGATGAVAASGGDSSGSGGAPHDGAGGTPDGTDLPLAEGCEARSRTETADSCSLALFCDTVSRVASCQRLGSDRWQCRCEPVNAERVYHVENAPGLEACAVAASLCPDEEFELGAERCEPSLVDSPDGTCATELACGRPIELDLPTDARAWLMRLGSASCQPSEYGAPFTCGCTYEPGKIEHQLTFGSDSLACDELVDFCMTGGSPEPDGTRECLQTSAFSSAEGCQRDEVCFVRSADGSGKPQSRHSDCEPLVGGGSRCYCSAHDSLFSFRSSDAPTEPACAAAALNCDTDANVVLTGFPSCEPTSSEAIPHHCQADFDCAEDATVDGREIVAEGRLLVACRRVDEDGPWWCSCASDQKTSRFELGRADIDAPPPCDQARAHCMENLPVHFGPYGPFVPAPDPLP